METIQGIVEKAIFYNSDSHYGVFLISLANVNDRPLTIVGDFYNIEIDSTYEFSGDYIEHPRFGLQFKVTSYKRVVPSDEEHIIRYLSGPSFPGIGKISAELIVEKYGTNVLEDLRNDPSMKLTIKGISNEKMERLKETVLQQNPNDLVIEFLNTHGISGKNAVKVLSYYKENTQDMLMENPYRLLEEIPGIGFKTADKMAIALGFKENHPYRIEGLFLDRLKSITFGPGHSFITKEDIYDSLHEIDATLLDDAYNALLKKRYIVQDEERLYHYTQYDAETFIARFLNDFEYIGDKFELQDFDYQIEEVQKKLQIDFDKQQLNAIQEFLNNDIMVLTGGPGTGKSTLLSGIVTLMQVARPELHITLAAPTGRAAKRLEELTNVNASTIHSALKWSPDTNEFGVNEFAPLDTDILIVDEFSMVDTWIFYKLLLASSQVKKILFVGDKDQLPSVGPGFVLGDLIESKQFPIVLLEHNYRQAAGSEVVDLALKMNKGLFSVDEYHKDVRFFDKRFGSVQDIVLILVKEALDKGYSIYDIQVLAPVYAGSSGIDYLNYALQNAFNPPEVSKREYRFGTRTFREGDKILQLKNQPDDMVYNGDIGILVEIDERRHLIVDFEGTYVEYDSTNLINISHAYCMSVHKSQGSEYPIVVLLGSLEYRDMLSKRLYYTAVTRSSKALLLIGDERAFQKAVQNSHEDKRNTYLIERLIEIRK